MWCAAPTKDTHVTAAILCPAFLSIEVNFVFIIVTSIWNGTTGQHAITILSKPFNALAVTTFGALLDTCFTSFASQLFNVMSTNAHVLFVGETISTCHTTPAITTAAIIIHLHWTKE